MEKRLRIEQISPSQCTLLVSELLKILKLNGSTHKIKYLSGCTKLHD